MARRACWPAGCHSPNRFLSDRTGGGRTSRHPCRPRARLTRRWPHRPDRRGRGRRSADRRAIDGRGERSTVRASGRTRWTTRWVCVVESNECSKRARQESTVLMPSLSGSRSRAPIVGRLRLELRLARAQLVLRCRAADLGRPGRERIRTELLQTAGLADRPREVPPGGQSTGRNHHTDDGSGWTA